MRFITQFIQTLISRFRNDVYLEATESGTIASGGNLGLDSNNKIVKAAEVGSSVDLTSEVTGVLPVANGGSGASTLASGCVLTGNGTSAITAQSTFTYGTSGDGSATTTMGQDTGDDLSIIRRAHSDGDGGPLKVMAGSATNGQTDKAGGDLQLHAGLGTGALNGGDIQFYSHKRGSSGGTLGTPAVLASIQPATTATQFLVYEDAGASTNDFFGVTVSANGETLLQTKDTAAAAAHMNILSDGDLSITSTTNKISKIYDFHAVEFENTYSDDQGSGTILKYSPDSNQTLDGSTLHFLENDGTWALTDADQVTTGASQLLGVGLGASARTTGVLIKGFVRIASTEILNVPAGGAVDGLPVYVSTTSGHFDFTAPSNSNDFVRIVGYAIDDDSGDVLIYFDPSKSWVEIA